MARSYLFYDIETTGLNKAFDQVLQFAAIRTDLEFNELERHEIFVKLAPDVVPSPYALITHQISIKDSPNGISEIDAIQKIHRLMNTPGTISAGYNTLNFDDEFLRFSFHRNLLPPYTHQYANQCSRLDLYPMTVIYSLFKNNVLNWPKREDKTSFKLEDLSTANQLAAGPAHNALVDVTATIALAKRLNQESEMWQYLLGYFDKKTASERMLKLTPTITWQNQIYYEGLFIDGSLGAEQYYQCPVLGLGKHRHYTNQNLWLRLDKKELCSTTAESIAETTWVFRTKSGEAELILPMQERFLKHLTADRIEIINKNKQWLLQNPDLLQKLAHYHREYTYPFIPDLDVDAALYQNGFLSQEEQRLCEKFHIVPITQKSNIIEQFKNPSLRTQSIRILGRHYPEHLPAAFAEEYTEYLQKINPINADDGMLDYRGQQRLTVKKALEEINALKGNTNIPVHQLVLLKDLEHYLKQRFC